MNEPRRYRVQEVIGRGSFGVVYRAELLSAGGFSKPVALKVLHGSFDPTSEVEQRLRDEARLLGKLRHPAVVHVDGLARLPDGWAVVMEYIPGLDVGVLIRRSALPPRVGLEIAEVVASALHAAWALPSPLTGQPLKLVHRDLKPGNLRITAHGEVKILDFGAARAEAGEREASTQAWRFGTPKYMAPERHDGIEGPEGDIYALGLVLAQLLTGLKAPDPPTNPDRHAAFVSDLVTSVEAHLRSRLEPRPGADSCAEEARSIALLIEEMLAFGPDTRPGARQVQQRLRALADAIGGASLRAWAEAEIPRLMAIQAPLTRDERCGEVIEESQGQPTLVKPLPPPPPDRTEPRPASGVRALPAAWLGLGAALMLGLAILVLRRPRPDEAPQAPAADDLAAADVQIGGGRIEIEPPELVGEPTEIEGEPVTIQGEPARVFAGTTRPPEPAAPVPEPERAGQGEAPAPEPVAASPSPPEVTTVVIPAAPPKITPPRPDPASFSVSAKSRPAELWAARDGRTWPAGEVPPGTYTLYVRFAEGQEAIPAATFSVGEGEQIALECEASLAVCRRKR